MASKKKQHENHDIIGRALAGHAFIVQGDEKKAAEYKNPLTDFVNLIIAEAKVEMELKKNDRAG